MFLKDKNITNNVSLTEMLSGKVLKWFKSKTTGILVKGSNSSHRCILIESDFVTVAQKRELPSILCHPKASNFVARAFIQNSLKVIHICLFDRSLDTVSLK